jgi:hypothetical protein
VGDTDGAARRLAEWWSRVASARYLRIRFTKLYLLHVRARVAITAAARGDARRHLAAAGRDAAAIRRTRESWMMPLAQLLEAGIAARRGDVAGAAQRLEGADAGLEKAGMPLFAAAARWQRGMLVGGEEGRDLVAAAEAWMRAEAIAAPARFAELLVPGFARP